MISYEAIGNRTEALLDATFLRRRSMDRRGPLPRRLRLRAAAAAGAASRKEFDLWRWPWGLGGWWDGHLGKSPSNMWLHDGISYDFM